MDGRPGCNYPMGTIVLLVACKSYNRHHFPDLFCMTNMGVFQGDVEGSICPAASCSCTNSRATDNFGEERDHWSIWTGTSLFQVIISAWSSGGAIALKKNFDTLAQCDHSYVNAYGCRQALAFLS